MSHGKQIEAEACGERFSAEKRQGREAAGSDFENEQLMQLLADCATAIIAVDADTCELLFVNRAAMDIMDVGANYRGRVCREYFGRELEVCQSCELCTGRAGESHRDYYVSELQKYLIIDTKLFQWGLRRVLVKYFRDVSEKYAVQEELNRREQMLSAVIKQSGLNHWEYYMDEDRVVSSDASIMNLGVASTMEDFPESFIAQGRLLPKYAEQYRKLHKDIKAGEPTATIEQRVRLEDGSIVWQRVRYDTIFDDDGRPVKALASCIDITREKELVERYDDMLALQDMTMEKAVATFLINLTKNKIRGIKSRSESVRALQNKRVEEMVALISCHIPDKKQKEEYCRVCDRTRLMWLYQKQGVREHKAVFSYVASGERTRWLEIKASLTKEPSTGDLLLYAYVEDVTESTVREQLLALVGETLVRALIHIDLLTTSVTMFTAGMETPRHFTDYDSFVSVETEKMAAMGLRVQDADISECLSLDTICCELSDKDEYCVSVRIDEDGEASSYYRMSCYYVDENRSAVALICSDITESVREQLLSQARLERALKEAETATKAKSDFLSSVSHDMRTPMNGILGLASLTLDIEGLPAEARENLQSLVQSSRFLLQLINDTLDMSKIESSKIELTLQPTKGITVLDNVVALVMPSVREKRLNLIVRKNSGLEHYVMMDRIRMEQIMMNLLSNAVKFTDDGGSIEISVDSLGVEDGVSRSVITVSDTGCGMDEEFLPKLFEPFSQEKPSYSMRTGTGLGMPIVKNLVELMGGSIEVESKKGRGSKFTINMSFKLAEEPQSAPEHTAHRHDSESFSGKRVLFVEDHPVNVMVGRKMLESKGMEVTHAENGRLGVDAFVSSGEGFFDVVLMDILMPEMDGYEATRAIRALPRGDAKSVPIIAMTANAFSEDVLKSLEAGMNAHIAKPVEPELLWRTLHEWISQSADRA